MSNQILNSMMADITGNTPDTTPNPDKLAQAKQDLAAAGLTGSQVQTIVGSGLRNREGCANKDTILNKYAAGALSIIGVMGQLYGTDSPQHHAGNTKGIR